MLTIQGVAAVADEDWTSRCVQLCSALQTPWHTLAFLGSPYLSTSQRPCASRLARVAGMEGRKCPSSPVVQSPGISQMRKKPRMWSILYAWKYLQPGGECGGQYGCTALGLAPQTLNHKSLLGGVEGDSDTPSEMRGGSD